MAQQPNRERHRLWLCGPLDPDPMTDPAPDSHWTFLTNHTHVLLCLVRRPDSTLRQVAGEVGITERAVQRIVRELEQAGVLTRTRQGRRNTYTVDAHVPLRHPLEAHRTVGHLLALLDGETSPETAAVPSVPQPI